VGKCGRDKGGIMTNRAERNENKGGHTDEENEIDRKNRAESENGRNGKIARRVHRSASGIRRIRPRGGGGRKSPCKNRRNSTRWSLEFLRSKRYRPPTGRYCATLSSGITIVGILPGLKELENPHPLPNTGMRHRSYRPATSSSQNDDVAFYRT